MFTTRIADALELAELLRPSWARISAGIARQGVPTCEVADATLKDTLKRIEAELASARDDRVAAVNARDEARQAFAASGNLSQDSDEFKAAQEAVRALGEIDDRIAELQTIQVETLKMLGRDAPAASTPGHDRPAGDPTDPRGGWSSAHLFDDEVKRAALEHAATTKSRFGGIDLGQVATRDSFAADVTGTPNMRQGTFYGVLPQIRRPLRILDLIPTGTMDQNTLPYTQESGSFATAAETAEGIAKPEAAVTFTDATATAVTIAHWMKLLKQSLQDFPALQSIIDGRLRYGVLRRLEAEVLAGNGTSPNMRGILATSGIGAVTFTAGQLPADQILKGVTTVLLADAQADAIVLHPTDWQTVLLAKTSGSGEYLNSKGPFEVSPQVMWGVPLIPSIAVTQGSALVGDFAIGAQLFIRDGVNVLLSDSDQDDFIKNRVTLLAEMRAGLLVWRPSGFFTTTGI